jgi:transposase
MIPMTEQDAHDTTARKPRYRTPDRNQIDPNPKVLDKLVSEDHLVRSIWGLVQELDFTSLEGTVKAVEGHPGRPKSDWKVLVALWIYGTIEGISSARFLATRCFDCDPYKWLRGGVPVDYHMLSDFRSKNDQWLRQQVALLVATLCSEGLITLDKVGQDGLRVRASAGSGSFKKEKKLDELLELAQQQWDELQAEFEQGTSERTPAQKAAAERALQERLERLKQAKAEVEKVQAAKEARKKGDGETARASTTDPDARRMKMPSGGYRPGYNVQFVTTLDTHVIVSVDVTNSGSDHGQMDPMMDQIETCHGRLPKECHADGGFNSIDDIEKLGKRKVLVYTPVKEANRQQKEGKDPYAPRKGDGEHAAAWRARMGTDEGKQKYKERCKCELSNANARKYGMYSVLVRGLTKVKSVAALIALTYNVMRTIKLRQKAAMS